VTFRLLKVIVIAMYTRGRSQYCLLVLYSLTTYLLMHITSKITNYCRLICYFASVKPVAHREIKLK